MCWCVFLQLQRISFKSNTSGNNHLDSHVCSKQIEWLRRSSLIDCFYVTTIISTMTWKKKKWRWTNIHHVVEWLCALCKHFSSGTHSDNRHMTVEIGCVVLHERHFKYTHTHICSLMCERHSIILQNHVFCRSYFITNIPSHRIINITWRAYCKNSERKKNE